MSPQVHRTIALLSSSARMTRFFAAGLTPLHRMTAWIVSRVERERERGCFVVGVYTVPDLKFEAGPNGPNKPPFHEEVLSFEV